MGVY